MEAGPWAGLFLWHVGAGVSRPDRDSCGVSEPSAGPHVYFCEYPNTEEISDADEHHHRHRGPAGLALSRCCDGRGHHRRQYLPRSCSPTVRDIVGGRSATYETCSGGSSRGRARRDGGSEPTELGANGVIGIDLDYEVLGKAQRHVDGVGERHGGDDLTPQQSASEAPQRISGQAPGCSSTFRSVWQRARTESSRHRVIGRNSSSRLQALLMAVFQNIAGSSTFASDH